MTRFSKILAILFLFSVPVFSQTSIEPSTYTVKGVEGVDYVIVEGVKVSRNRVYAAPDAKESIVSTDKDFGYITRRKVVSKTLESEVFIDDIYLPFYRNGVLVGRWHQGQVYDMEVSTK